MSYKLLASQPRILTPRCPFRYSLFAILHSPTLRYAMLVLAAAGAEVRAQSNSSMVTDPGSSITLTVTFNAQTDFGPISGSDTDTTDVGGTARVTLLPTDPPFTDCRVHSLTMAFGTIELDYMFYTISATFTDLVIESTEPFDGTIDGAGNITFATTPLRVTGMVHLYSAIYGVDQTMPVEVSGSQPISARLTESEGIVILDEIVIPFVEWDVPPEYLPDGFQTLHVAVASDAGQVVFSGPYAPAMPGDSDADDDVDLLDLSAFAACLTGPEPAADPLPSVFCSLFWFDDDADVDLRDFAGFQNAFTDALSG